jgi:hypothetical protein
MGKTRTKQPNCSIKEGRITSVTMEKSSLTRSQSGATNDATLNFCRAIEYQETDKAKLPLPSVTLHGRHELNPMVEAVCYG